MVMRVDWSALTVALKTAISYLGTVSHVTRVSMDTNASQPVAMGVKMAYARHQMACAHVQMLAGLLAPLLHV